MNLKEMLAHLISGTEKISGIKCDTIIVGSDSNADKIREALTELGKDYHVIADDEISPKSIWVTSQADLNRMPGGGQN